MHTSTFNLFLFQFNSEDDGSNARSIQLSVLELFANLFHPLPSPQLSMLLSVLELTIVILSLLAYPRFVYLLMGARTWGKRGHFPPLWKTDKNCGARWCRGKFGALQPEGCGFESTSSRRVG